MCKAHALVAIATRFAMLSYARKGYTRCRRLCPQGYTPVPTVQETRLLSLDAPPKRTSY